MDVFKMFESPEKYGCKAFFCVFEDGDSFYGYLISKNKGKFSISMKIEDENKLKTYFMVCDDIIEIKKSDGYLKKLKTQYNLKELRDLTEIIRVGKVDSRCLNAKQCEIPNYVPNVNLEEKRMKRNQLADAKKKAELAGINNNRNLKKESEKLIEKLNYELGYRETPSTKYKVELKDTVTNTRPLQGGDCSPR